MLQAMLGSHNHSHTSEHTHEGSVSDHDTNIWRGLVAMLGVVFFYFTEKCLTMVAECRKKRQRRTQVTIKILISPIGMDNFLVLQQMPNHYLMDI